MHGLKTERHRIKTNSSVSADIAQHLKSRLTQGKVCVVTDKPKDLMPAVKKQWFKMIRKVQRQRAATLKATEILEYTQQIAHMQRMRFVANAPDDMIGVDVGFAVPAQVLGYAPDCQTMYITCRVARDKLHLMTAMMPPTGIVVVYGDS